VKLGRREKSIILLGVVLGLSAPVISDLIWLNGDEAVIRCIVNSGLVEYDHIELGGIIIFTKDKDPTTDPHVVPEEMWSELTLFNRHFTAYEYPEDSVPGEENWCIDGFVDMKRRVHVIGKRRTDAVYY